MSPKCNFNWALTTVHWRNKWYYVKEEISGHKRSPNDGPQSVFYFKCAVCCITRRSSWEIDSTYHVKICGLIKYFFLPIHIPAKATVCLFEKAIFGPSRSIYKIKKKMFNVSHVHYDMKNRTTTVRNNVDDTLSI